MTACSKRAGGGWRSRAANTDGSEAGTRTAVTIDFNPIIFLEE